MKFLKWLDNNFEEKIMMVLLMAMTLIMGVQVFCRYVLNDSLSWSEEITRYLFIWITFLSIGYCIEKNISLRIDQFVNVLPFLLRIIIQIVVMMVSAAFFLYMVIQAWDYVANTIATNQISSATSISMAWVHSSTIVGFGCAFIRAIERIIKDFIQLRKDPTGKNVKEEAKEDDIVCQL